MTKFKARFLASVAILITLASAGPAWADATPECNVDGVAVDSTECGVGSDASGDQSTAVGDDARALGVGSIALGHNTLANGQSSIAVGLAARADGFGSVAIGPSTLAEDVSVAIGYRAIAKFSGTANVDGLGFTTAVAQGAAAVAVGPNTVAIGSTARAGTSFGLDAGGPDAVGGLRG